MNKVEIEGGATLWARQTIESEIFYDKPDKWFKIWFYLVNRVNHKKNRKWDRGECLLNYQEIMIYTGATRNQVDHCIRWLKEATMIATQKATRGMHIKVLRYDYFQRLDNYYYNIKSDTESEIKATQKRNRGDTKNKNGNNGKKEINTVAKATTTILINKELFPMEELEYVSLEDNKRPSRYGNRVMAVLVRYYAELTGTKIKGTFDASEWSKPLGAIYRYFDKDPDKAMAYMKRAVEFYKSNEWSYTIHTLTKSIPDTERLIEEQDNKKFNPELYEDPT